MNVRSLACALSFSIEFAVHEVWKVEASVVVILERPPPFCVGCVQSVLEVSDLHLLSPRVSSQQGPDTCTSCTIAFGKNAALFVALDVGERCVPSFPVRWMRGLRFSHPLHLLHSLHPFFLESHGWRLHATRQASHRQCNPPRS
jgi:hypothetical protein